VLARGATRDELVARARLRLEDARGGEVVVLAADGTVQETRLVGTAPRRPWWYVRPGLLRWLLPALFGLQLALRVVAGSTGPPEVALAVLLAVAFAFLGVAGWRSSALDRTRAAADDVTREAG